MTLKTGASVALLMLLLGVSVAAAQTAPPQQRPTAPATTEIPKVPVTGQILVQDPNTVLAKELIGLTVYAPDKAKIGAISDLILAKDARTVDGFVIGVGGFLGIGEKSVALKWIACRSATTAAARAADDGCEEGGACQRLVQVQEGTKDAEGRRSARSSRRRPSNGAGLEWQTAARCTQVCPLSCRHFRDPPSVRWTRLPGDHRAPRSPRFCEGLGALSMAMPAGPAAGPLPRRRSRSRAGLPRQRRFNREPCCGRRKGRLVPNTRRGSPLRVKHTAEPTRAGVSPEVAEKLEAMRFDEFERLYHTDGAQSSGPATRGALGDTISVGHVGLIELGANGIAYVVEATPQGPAGKTGVIRTRYADWLNAYANIQVWHGRVRNLDARQRGRTLEAALAQLGKPYDFFNFDLNDDSGFYCSKLVWMCLWRTASLALDDNPDPRRGLRFPPWFSPKQLISVKRVEVLHKPGSIERAVTKKGERAAEWIRYRSRLVPLP
jgi:hypothetical protein